MASVYDVEWQEGPALDLEFTPNDDQKPVVAQIPSSVPTCILNSPIAVGDILLSFSSPHEGTSGKLDKKQSFATMLEELQKASPPLTLTFLSRENATPDAVTSTHLETKYSFAWQPDQSLGVALAMDPCSLHTVITKVGDLMLAIQDTSRDVWVDLSVMRFERVIETVKSMSKPCKLAFGRLKTGGSSGEEEGGQEVKDKSKITDWSHMSGQHHSRHRRLTNKLSRQPIAKRMSFRVGQQPESQTTEPQRPRSKSSARRNGFYTVTFDGRPVGLELKDITKETKSTNGYCVSIRTVKDPELKQNAREGDLLMGVGNTDFQHRSYSDVQKVLSQIRGETQLLFKHRKEKQVKGGSLADALLLFFI